MAARHQLYWAVCPTYLNGAYTACTGFEGKPCGVPGHFPPLSSWFQVRESTNINVLPVCSQHFVCWVQWAHRMGQPVVMA